MAEKHIHDVKVRLEDQDRQKILDWLTPIDYDPQQSYISKRQPGTGQWLLNSAEYQDWLKADKQTLFCLGIPGAGKTFITSIVIEYLQTNYKSSGVAYLYCNIGQQGQQTLESLLGSILKQLVWNRSPLPQEVKDLYDQHKDKRSRPELMEISKILQSDISPGSKTFVIIDALDECQNHDRCRNSLLSEIFALQAKTRLNIFATSRPQEVEAEFSGCIIREIIATDNDIEAYLEDEMSLWEKSHEGNLSTMRDMIKKEVTKAADGM
jgi:Cdc6-like AAA superfamily ATPase